MASIAFLKVPEGQTGVFLRSCVNVDAALMTRVIFVPVLIL